MKVYCIYGLYGDDEIIRYVGKTTNIHRRLRDHLRHADNRKTHRDNWILSENKKVDYIVLDWTLVKDSANILERKYIAQLKNLTNHTRGGDGSLGFKHSEETKAKFRARTDFNLEGLRRPEAIAKMAESKRGRRLPLELRQRLSNIHKGRKKSAQHAANIAKAKLGTRLTETAKRKVGEASKARWQNPEFRERALRGLREWRATNQNINADF